MQLKSGRIAFTGTIACVVAACGLTAQSKAEEAVRAKLLDPGSAEFRNVKVCLGDDTMIEGEVNSKNTFGGYVGFKSFYYADGEVRFIDDQGVIPFIERCSVKNAAHHT